MAALVSAYVCGVTVLLVVKCCEKRCSNVTRVYVVGIKKYIVGLIIKTSSDVALLEREKVYLGKLNMILVQACSCCCHTLTLCHYGSCVQLYQNR